MKTLQEPDNRGGRMSPMLRSREGHPSLQRPHRPARTHRRAGRPRQQPALVVAPADARPVLRDRPEALGQGPQGPRPAALGPVRRRARRPRRRRGVRRAGARRRRGPADLPHRAALVPGAGPRPVEGGAPASIAYFSPEYGITEVLPQYSGGLGILAGDHLKSASDLGVPDRRRRPVLQDRLLQAVAQPRRLAAGELPGPRPRRPAAVPAARGRRHPLPSITLDLPGGRTLHGPRLEGAGRPRAAAAARLRRAGQRRRGSATSPTGCTAAAASTACSRRCCSASAASARCGCGRG